MNYPYQNPNYTYQTPNPNPPQQPGQFIQPDQFTQSGQPLPNSANAYSNPGQQGILSLFFFRKADGLLLSSSVYSYYPDGTLQPQPSGQRHSSRSPNTRNIPFPEPHQSGPVGHPQTYIPPSLTTPNLTVPTNYQHDRQSSHGSSYGSQGLPAYSAGAGSNTGGSNYYSQQPGVQYLHEGGYNATAVYEDAQGHAPLALSPGFPPVGSHSKHTFDFVSFTGVSSSPVLRTPSIPEWERSCI